MFPRKWPKSMWKRFPEVVTMMLSLWRSPMPCRRRREEGKYYINVLARYLYMCSNLPAHRWPQSSQHRTEQRCPRLQPTCQNQPHHTHWMRKQPIHIHSTLEHQYCMNVCLDQSITDFSCWLLIHSNSFLLSLVPETCTEGRIDRQQKVCYTWPHNQICESTVSYQPLQWF